MFAYFWWHCLYCVAEWAVLSLETALSEAERFRLYAWALRLKIEALQARQAHVAREHLRLQDRELSLTVEYDRLASRLRRLGNTVKKFENDDGRKDP